MCDLSTCQFHTSARVLPCSAFVGTSATEYPPAALQEHIRCSLELSCLAQCLDLHQRMGMAQEAISQLTGPLDFSAQPPSPAPRSPKSGPGKATLQQACHTLLQFMQPDLAGPSLAKAEPDRCFAGHRLCPGWQPRAQGNAELCMLANCSTTLDPG